MANLDDILRKVQAMLARADHPNTPPHEADTARNMAEALMIKYRIEETMFKEASTTLGPVWRTIHVCRANNEFRNEYRQLLAAVLDHFDARGVFMHVSVQPEEGALSEPWVVADCVGYESDLRFAEAMFTAAALAFGKRLEPKYDPELSDQVNAYLMRSAGMEGRRIAMAIYGKDDKALRPKVRAMFRKEAEARGEDPTPLLGKGVNVKGWRDSYAQGFTSTFWTRLGRMRLATSADRTALVLADRKGAVDEAFWTKYPMYRPMPADTPRIGNGRDMCAKCARAKSGYCRDHAWMRPRASDRGPSLNYGAYQRGGDAARSVDLGITGREIQ